MIYNINYNICAVCIFVVMLIIHCTKKKNDFQHNKIFTYILFSALFGTIFDIICALDNNGAIELRRHTYLLSCYGYYTFHHLTPFLFVVYVMVLAEREIKKESWHQKVIVFYPLLMHYILLALNPVFNWLFYLDQNGGYHRGSIIGVFYLETLYYLHLGILKIRFLKGQISIKTRLAFHVFFIVAAGVAVFQYFLPEYLVESFGTALCALLIMMSVQGSEMYIDPVVGLFNRRSFERVFNMNRRREKYHRILLIVLEDVIWLHQKVGDEIYTNTLYEVGEFLEKLKSKGVFCLAPNTFAILLTDSRDESVSNIINTIMERFEQEWKLKQDTNIKLVARLLDIDNPEQIQLVEQIYDYCDYLEKLDNHKQWVLHASQLNLGNKLRRLEIEACVKKAIEKNGFEMYYQPIYSTKTQSFVSAEALIRLRDEKLGFISPDEFITLSEENGSIYKIGDIVFQKVFQFIKDHNLKELGLQHIAINLSVVQGMQDDLAISLLRMIEKYKIKKEYVNIEITETAAVNSPKVLRDNINYLSEAGIKFSLDDYGTGYANMHSLMTHPFDVVKLDKCLADMAMIDKKGEIVVNSSVQMTKQMHMRCVVEGVETEEQVDYFTRIGVDYLQGYYFSKPLPEDKLLELLKKSRSNYSDLCG